MVWFYRIRRFVLVVISNLINYIIFFASGIIVGRGLKTCGIVTCLNYTGKGKIVLGNSVSINSCRIADPIGGDVKTLLLTYQGGKIEIGNHVGISNSSLCAYQKIRIEDDVCIGAGCKIYDTDFHSINPLERLNENTNIKKEPVLIKKNAFIGAHCIILKGVTIGENAVVAAGAVVSRDIPDGEVWGGNPAHYIKKVI